MRFRFILTFIVLLVVLYFQLFFDWSSVVGTSEVASPVANEAE